MPQPKRRELAIEGGDGRARSHRRAVTRSPDESCPVCGRDSCEEPSHVPPPGRHQALSDRTNGRAGEQERTAVVLRTADEIIAMPRPREIIEGVTWAGALNVLAREILDLETDQFSLFQDSYRHHRFRRLALSRKRWLYVG